MLDQLELPFSLRSMCGRHPEPCLLTLFSSCGWHCCRCGYVASISAPLTPASSYMRADPFKNASVGAK